MNILNKTFFFILTTLLCSCITISKSSLKDNTSTKYKTITISGKITVLDSDSPPLGIVTINVKNKWAWMDTDINKGIRGENVRTYADKKGEYSIDITPGDTLVVLANTKLYHREITHTITNLYKDETINIVLKPNMKELDKTKQNKIIYNNLMQHINNANAQELVTVSGTIYNKENKRPIGGMIITQPWVSNTDYSSSFRLTDSLGRFKITVPKADLLSINPLDYGYKAVHLYPQNDTVINLYMERKNK